MVGGAHPTVKNKTPAVISQNGTIFGGIVTIFARFRIILVEGRRKSDRIGGAQSIPGPPARDDGESIRNDKRKDEEW